MTFTNQNETANGKKTEDDDEEEDEDEEAISILVGNDSKGGKATLRFTPGQSISAHTSYLLRQGADFPSLFLFLSLSL